MTSSSFLPNYFPKKFRDSLVASSAHSDEDFYDKLLMEYFQASATEKYDILTTTPAIDGLVIFTENEFVSLNFTSIIREEDKTKSLLGVCGSPGEYFLYKASVADLTKVFLSWVVTSTKDMDAYDDFDKGFPILKSVQDKKITEKESAPFLKAFKFSKDKEDPVSDVLPIFLPNAIPLIEGQSFSEGDCGDSLVQSSLVQLHPFFET